ALIGLDEAGVVVRLHLEDHRLTVPDIDDTGVLTRTLDDARPLGGERLEPFFRTLVRAVLVPHGREDAQLGESGHAADEVQNLLVLIGLEAVIGDEFGRDFDVVAERHGAVVDNQCCGAWSVSGFFSVSNPMAKTASTTKAARKVR